MEEGRSEEDNSMFETSHVLGALLASSPLLAQSWRRCAAAAAAGAAGLVADVRGGTAYVAFSGAAAAAAGAFAPAALGSGEARPLFAPLVAAEPDAGEPVVVQALALRAFLSLHGSPEFQVVLSQIRGKPVVFTGHSLGGAVAALAALHCLCAGVASPSPSPSPSSGSAAPPLLCVTFGSPLLGNAALSRAVLRERWGGNFCHVVAQHDAVPRLLFCPLAAIPPLPAAVSGEGQEELHELIAAHLSAVAMERELQSPGAAAASPYRPFGTYALCSPEGAVCVDSPAAAVQMLYVTFAARRPAAEAAARLSYGDLVLQMPRHLLLKKAPSGVAGDELPARSDFEAGISLALDASGVGVKGAEAAAAREWLKTSTRIGRRPSLNCAGLATKLGRITPCRAQLEWYKASFDDSHGYYDAFKLRLSPRRFSSANLNRIKLAHFWDAVLAMLAAGHLPHDFPRRAKWVNAARFYQLLVEPLDIADHHRHAPRGRYLAHARPRRYQVFDKWWRERDCTADPATAAARRRSKYAGLTQDPCFWARVEEAREWTDAVKRGGGGGAAVVVQALQGLREFEGYAKKLVESKEVSIDVLAPRSSYALWAEEWKEVKLRNGFHGVLQNGAANKKARS